MKLTVIHWFILRSLFLELPQLRSVTSMELGCDARGYSHAGNETAIWYCVILAGRSSPELNKMHAVSLFGLLVMLN